MQVDYVDHMGSDLTVVNTARVSFNKHKKEFGDDDEKLIKYLATHNHWTPFGHPQIQLRMKAPVPIRTQCFKHKVGFVENEVSRRYVSDTPEFFYPEIWRGKPTNGAKQGSDGQISNSLTEPTYCAALTKCLDAYFELLELGIAPEQARFVLPQAMYTEWYWTGSLAAFARFANLRLDNHAQGEVRDLAQLVNDVVQPLFPISWKYLTNHEVPE